MAFAKGQFRTGGWHIPTRIAVFDGYLLRDSDEAGGGIPLRWEALAQVLRYWTHHLARLPLGKFAENFTPGEPSIQNSRLNRPDEGAARVTFQRDDPEQRKVRFIRGLIGRDLPEPATRA